jgi:FAD/FMN-containing dehydrogenase
VFFDRFGMFGVCELIRARYINFAHGDETLEAIYGSSLPRLREVKKKYDPTGAFNQWFAITP